MSSSLHDFGVIWSCLRTVSLISMTLLYHLIYILYIYIFIYIYFFLGNVDVVKVYGGCLNGVPALYRVSGTFTDCPLDSNIPEACYTDDTNLVNGGSKCDDVQNELTSGDTDETITVCQPSSIGSYTDVAETGKYSALISRWKISYIRVN